MCPLVSSYLHGLLASNSCVSSISCKERHQHVGSFLICGEDPEVHPTVGLNLTSSSHTSFLWLLTTLSPLYTLQTTIILTWNPSMAMICCKPPTVPLASSPTSSCTHIHKIHIPKNYLLLLKKNYLFERGERERDWLFICCFTPQAAAMVSTGPGQGLQSRTRPLGSSFIGFFRPGYTRSWISEVEQPDNQNTNQAVSQNASPGIDF